MKIKYKENYKNVAQNSEAKCAIVLFRSMEGMRRALYHFNYTWYEKMIYKINIFCKKDQKPSTKIFKERWLYAEQAMEPDLIIWHNFRVNKLQIRLFEFLFFIVMVTILCICFKVIYMLEIELK